MRDKLSKTIIPGVVFLVFSIVMYLLMPEQVQTTETSAFTARTFPTMALMAVSVAIGNYTGLLVSGLLIGAGFLALYRDKKPLHYVIVIAIIAVSYFLFKQVFGLQLP